jgi:hypothetical protein
LARVALQEQQAKAAHQVTAQLAVIQFFLPLHPLVGVVEPLVETLGMVKTAALEAVVVRALLLLLVVQEIRQA